MGGEGRPPGLVLTALAALVFAAPASADVYTVNPADENGMQNNDGICQLWEAVEVANTDMPNAMDGAQCAVATSDSEDTIFMNGGVYELSGFLTVGDTTIGETTVLFGDSTEPVTIRQSSNVPDRVLRVNGAALTTIEGITIGSGRLPTGNGGGIEVATGSALTLSNSTLTANQAGTDMIEGDGGGIFVDDSATLTLINTTVSGNQATGSGGGLYLDSNANLEMQSSTVSNNTADSNLATMPGGVTGGVLFTPGGNLTVRNTIIAGNTDFAFRPDCTGFGAGMPTLEANLIGNNSECNHPTDAGLVDPPGGAGLAGLADNGGPTLTHALLEGSPAIDNGVAPCPATDQRGVSRPQRSACDIGALEAEPVPPPVPAPPAAVPAARRKKCKKGRKLVKRKGKRRCVKKKRRR